MARKSKQKRAAAGAAPPDNAPNPAEPTRRGRKGKAIVLLVAGLLFGVGAATLVLLEGHVLDRHAHSAPTRAKVVLLDRPEWMPPQLEREIISSLCPVKLRFTDPRLTEELWKRSEANPWVRRVRSVRRRMAADGQSGEILIEAEFRRPSARVPRPDGVRHVYVDEQGVVLPAEQTPKFTAELTVDGRARRVYFLQREDAPPHLRLQRIHYVEVLVHYAYDPPPPAPGRQWSSEALAAALRLVKLIEARREWAWQISAVSVENHDGRVARNEPHIRMYAQVGRGPVTDIRWGRFPTPDGDWVVSPERKLSYLDDFFRRHGRLAGVKEYIDLRYDWGYESIH